MHYLFLTDDGFTGLCARSLPNRCWGDDDRIYYDDMQKCYSQIMRINVNTGSVSCITSDTEKGEYVVLDVFEGLLLGQYTNPAHPMQIVHKPCTQLFHAFICFSLLLNCLLAIKALSKLISVTLVSISNELMLPFTYFSIHYDFYIRQYQMGSFTV